MGRYWLGIDIGGTFTDFTLYDRGTHDVAGLKVASTPPDFGMAVEDGLERLAREHAIDLSEIDVVVHGTTIAVNTLIQRTGARLGLLVTEGFRDVLEIQRLRLPNPLDLHGHRPEPLIPRGRVAEVREGAIDEGATAALRAERRATGLAPAPFHFGPARDAHERRWPPALQDAFIALLMSVPVPYRAYVRRALYARVMALADERPVTVDDLSRLWEELAAASALPVQFREEKHA